MYEYVDGLQLCRDLLYVPHRVPVRASGRPQLLAVDAAPKGTLVAAGTALQGNDAVIFFWYALISRACLSLRYSDSLLNVGIPAILRLRSGGIQQRTPTTSRPCISRQTLPPRVGS